MSNIKTVEIAPSFDILSSADLTAVCGGWGDSTPPASTSTGTTTVQPKLECPTGTSPEWVRATGDIGAHLAGGLSKGGGSGSYESFKCVPVPPSTQTPAPKG